MGPRALGIGGIGCDGFSMHCNENLFSMGAFAPKSLEGATLPWSMSAQRNFFFLD
jgi:hypothetical protein